MYRSLRMVALAALMTLSLLASAQVKYKYTLFHYPGAVATTANGINNGNVIVGSWTDAKNNTHGYRYSGGKFTTIMFPGSGETWVKGINDYGDVVGCYAPNNASATHGFLLHNGKFSTIDYPGLVGGCANGINKYGTIVGMTENNGFIYHGGTYTLYNAPSNTGPDTYLNGIANTGQIVGQVFSYDDWRAFLKAGSDVDFMSKVADYDNEAYGVNGRGDVVGFKALTGGWLALNPEAGENESAEGSVWKFQLLSINGNNYSTTPMSINYARYIVGNYNSQAFLAVPQ